MGDNSRVFGISGAVVTLALVCGACGDGPAAPSHNINAVSVASATPPNGPTVGSNIVRLSGSGFLSGATVTVDGASATNQVLNGSVISVTMPAHAAGSVDITVTNPSGQRATLRGGYTYLFIPPPVITDVQPRAGATVGGTPLTITGSGFTNGATVNIGGGHLASSFVASPNTIFATTLAHTAGTVEVTVTNRDGQTSSFTESFTFADASTFDFNGVWDGAAYGEGAGDHVLFRLTVRDNFVVSVVCGKDEEVSLSPPAPVSDGRFAFSGSGGAAVSGRILAPNYAEGGINIAPCLRHGWDAFKRQ